MKNLLNKVVQFLKDVRFELTKVTWPSRRELLGSTVIVVIMSVLVSVFIGVVDLGFSNLVSFLFSRG
jgi:preprotein translocase subunit SecE